MALPKLDVGALTPEERLQLIEQLWDSLEEDDVPLTPAQQADLMRRLANIEKNPGDQMSWEEAQRVIWGRRS
jgi:putative addiction module component (TIGR02574 family)